MKLHPVALALCCLAGIACNVLIMGPGLILSTRGQNDFMGLYPGGKLAGGPGVYDAAQSATVQREAVGYSNPRLDYVLANGLKATQTNARAVDYRVAQQIIHDERPVIVLYNRTSIVAYSASVGGVALDYKGQLQLANAQLS